MEEQKQGRQKGAKEHKHHQLTLEDELGAVDEDEDDSNSDVQSEGEDEATQMEPTADEKETTKGFVVQEIDEEDDDDTEEDTQLVGNRKNTRAKARPGGASKPRSHRRHSEPAEVSNEEECRIVSAKIILHVGAGP
jgi:hypothetical protein